MHEQIANLFGGDGSFSYSTSTAEYNFTNFVQDAYNVNPTLTSGAAGIVRHYNSFSQTVDQLTGVGADDFWNQNVDFFVEDQWKATPKLLLSAGIRYDVQLVPGPDMPYSAAVSPVAFKATSQINPDLHMIQPRLGFNWNPYPGTVIRGGWGLFYGQISNSSLLHAASRERRLPEAVRSNQRPDRPEHAHMQHRAPRSVRRRRHAGYLHPDRRRKTSATTTTATTSRTHPQGGVPIYTPPGPPADRLPHRRRQLPPPVSSAVPTGTITIRGQDPSFTNPLSQSYDLTVEQQLPLHTQLLHRLRRQPRQPPAGLHRYQRRSGLRDQLPHLPLHQRRHRNHLPPRHRPSTPTALFATTGTVATGFSILDSWYNSMVVQVRKPLSHGFELLSNYTWAKAMDTGQTYGGNGTFNGTDAPLNPFRLSGRSGHQR